MITAGLIAGAAIAFGSLLVAAGLLARPEPLADALERLSGSGQPRTPTAGTMRGRSIGWLGAVLGRTGLDAQELDRDLQVAGSTPEQHLTDKLTASVVGLGLPPVLMLIVTVGGMSVPLAFVVLAAVGLAAAGFVLPDLILRRRAAERRRAFRYALSSYLDLVNVILAAGAGVDTVLVA